jgi:hypothetical protein
MSSNMTRRLSPGRAAELVTARRGLRHSILERADLQTLLIPIKANADG